MVNKIKTIFYITSGEVLMHYVIYNIIMFVQNDENIVINKFITSL